MLIKIGKTKWLNVNDISFLNIDYNDRKQVYVVRIWVNDHYYDYYDYYGTYEKAVKALDELVEKINNAERTGRKIVDKE